MSMQISVDPAALSQEQREAVAGFILAYPGSAGTCGHAVAEIHVNGSTVDGAQVAKAVAHELAVLQHDRTHEGQTCGKITHADVVLQVGDRVLPVQPGVAVNELEVLQHDHESTLPVAAFGQPVVDEAAAAFGVPPVPLGVSVPLAVSTPAIAAGFIVAPPPPANTAPITTTPGVASSAVPASSTVSNSGVDLDAKGMPWDNRIHAESKGKIADGTWRKKRNLDPTLLAAVEAELRQVMGATGAPLVHSTAPIAPTPPLAPAAPVTANLPTASVSPAVAAPLPPAAPQAPVVGEVPADALAMFVALVGRASAAIQGQKVTQAEVNQCCADAGVPALTLLANRLDLVAQVAAHIDALIAARQ